MEVNKNQNWDVIVVGSGVGGLMVGALLSKYEKKKVLVLEKHDKIGGCTHTFRRKKNYVFDVGVHFLGWLGQQSAMRRILDDLSEERLQWKVLSGAQEKVFFSEEEFFLSPDRKKLSADLKSQFPEDSKALDVFFQKTRKYSKGLHLWQMTETLPSVLEWFVKKYLIVFYPLLFKTVKEVMDDLFVNEKTKALLACQWSAVGPSPEKCGFAFFASGFETHMAELCYPKGGGERIAEELASIICENGGEIKVSCEAKEILHSNHHVSGVRDVFEKRYFAKKVVSGVGAFATYVRLIQENINGYQSHLKKKNHGDSYVMLSMGLSESPLSFGIDSSNHWVFKDEKFTSFFSEEKDLEFINHLYISSPSLKRKENYHTVEILIPAPRENFAQWRNNKNSEYRDFKKKISSKVIDLVEERFPGFRASILFMEVSTPLTVERFVTGAGNPLSIPCTPERLNLPWARSRTPIQGLFITGADVYSWGVTASLAGAMKTFLLMKRGRSWKHLKKNALVEHLFKSGEVRKSDS